MTRGKTHILVDLRGCYRHPERGIPNYAINIALALSQIGIFDCSYLGHKYLSRLNKQDELERHGIMLWNEDLILHGAPDFDVFLITDVSYSLEARDVFRSAIPECILASRPLFVSVLYDLIPLLFADEYLTHPKTRADYFNSLRLYELSDHIFAISKATRADGVKYLKVDASAISTIAGGIDEVAWAPRNGESLRSNDVIYVGGHDFRKNLKGLLRGYKLFLTRNPVTKLKLKIICSMDRLVLQEYSKGLCNDSDRIVFTGFLTQDVLTAEVAQAKASIFPSLYEGLGLPILESYAVGTPVLGSNTSSIAELVIPQCRFDPTCDESIASSFEIIERRPDILIKSIEEGRKILSRHNWVITAEQISTKINDLLSTRLKKSVDADFIAIVGPLAPEQTGIALYNTAAFVKSSRNIIFLSTMRSRSDAEQKYALLRQGHGDGVIIEDSGKIPLIVNRDNCEAVVFVLGNSAHCVGELEMAIKFRAHRVPKIIYLHEARVLGLLLKFFGKGKRYLVERLAEYYPEIKLGVDPMHLGGMRLLCALVGNADIYVNSKRCAQLIRSDIAGYAAPFIDVIFLPILDQQSKTIRSDDGIFRIAHFGIFSPIKSPEIVIGAARKIARRRSTRVLFAGYNCDPACHESFVDPDLVDWIRAPTDQELVELMRSVDVIVQPREHDHGEASGVICQAIAAGKIPVTSAGTAADDLGMLVKTVPRGGDLAAWSRAIEDAALGPVAGTPRLEHLGVESFCRDFDAAIGRTIQRASAFRQSENLRGI